jgi:hypothetical protein
MLPLITRCMVGWRSDTCKRSINRKVVGSRSYGYGAPNGGGELPRWNRLTNGPPGVASSSCKCMQIGGQFPLLLSLPFFLTIKVAMMAIPAVCRCHLLACSFGRTDFIE